MSSVYNYSLFQHVQGDIFVEGIYTRSLYFVSDRNKRFCDISLYLQNGTATPLLYASYKTSRPTESESSAYSVNLYNAKTKSVSQAVRVTPSDVSVASDLVVPNDIYVGSTKDWRIHVNASSRAIQFQRKDVVSGVYVTEYEIRKDVCISY